ncbi:MAG: 2-hydroxy-3-oxopropionate reductase [Bifidobacteriaceae bacterium]|jgi:2-hydroxy-3-oxopropionate reductase|nr:2-hydroxy-3-oxopropionate reductase [Bifidobacteriaceae bacterium]
MTTIGLIGLGIMGSPMARNWLQAGFAVQGFDFNPKRLEELAAAGGTPAGNATEAIRGADIVAMMVPDSPDVLNVLTAPGGVFETAPAGTLVIDFSTIRPDVAADAARQAREHGLRFLDAPVSGGEAGAIAGSLSIMVGGSDEDFAAAAQVFAAVGKTIVHVGPNGAGQTVKAANQLIVAANMQALAEAVLFLEAFGVDMEAAIAVLKGGLAGSAVMEQKATKMVTREFAPGFKVNLHHKDMGIVTAAAREAGVVIPVGALMAQLMASARANGDGDQDHSALLRGVERLSGPASVKPGKAA